MNLICMQIPLSKTEAYRQQGWDITYYDCNHGAYSALACREEF